jgi:hypothetical protein
MTASASPEPDRTSGQAFARLVGELEELGFEPTWPLAHPNDTVYTATDSAVAITTVDAASDPHVCVSARRGNGAAWSMHWTATTPTTVQLIAPYAVVNEDPSAALAAAAAAHWASRRPLVPHNLHPPPAEAPRRHAGVPDSGGNGGRRAPPHAGIGPRQPIVRQDRITWRRTSRPTRARCRLRPMGRRRHRQWGHRLWSRRVRRARRGFAGQWCGSVPPSRRGRPASASDL